MATSQGNLFKIQITDPGDSVLALCAAAMPVGSWRKFNGTTQDGVPWPVPADQYLQLADIPVGVTGITPYMNKAAWNPITKEINVVAKDHGIDSGLTQVNYSEVDHRWYGFGVNSYTLLDPGPPAVYGPPYGPGVINAPYTGGHAYDHVAVNPFNGDLYSATYGQTGTLQPICFRRTPSSGITFTMLPNRPSVQMVGTHAVAWWKGAFTGGGGLGAQGGWAFCSRKDTNTSAGSPPTVNDGSVAIFDPTTNTWPFVASGMTPMLTDHVSSGEQNMVAAYSTVKNCLVMGGGHGNSRRMWRLNSNGTSTELTTAPEGVAVGVHYGFFVPDPVTGNFLVITGTTLWELNPDGAGTWTQQTGARVPPNILSGQSIENAYAFCCELPDHGVVAVIQQRGATEGFWLYKHA